MTAILKKCIPIAAFVFAAPVSAQVWDTPSFFSPRPGEDIGVYAFKPDGADWGFAGIWRQEGNLNLGVRLGVTGNSDVMVGSEFYKPLTFSGSPLLVSWVLGAGATFGDNYTSLRIPFGVSVGAHVGQGTGMQILPYAHPRVAFDYAAFDDAAGNEQTDSEFNFDLDIGADVTLGSSWTARVGATVTNGGVVGVGLAYHMSRRLIVR